MRANYWGLAKYVTRRTPEEWMHEPIDRLDALVVFFRRQRRTTRFGSWRSQRRSGPERTGKHGAP